MLLNLSDIRVRPKSVPYTKSTLQIQISIQRRRLATLPNIFDIKTTTLRFQSTMPPYSTILFALPCILGLTTAIPPILAPRSGSSYTGSDGAERFSWPSEYPTCGNDKSMSQFSTTITVNTQQDCDPVIDTICRAAAQQSTTNARNLGHSIGTCEGHILFPGATSSVTYADCVQGFQSVTETCILMGGPKNYAAVGKQFGLRNLQYFPAVNLYYPGGTVWAWTVGSATDPGYLMGPPHVFGDDFHAMDADDVLSGNTTKVKGY